MDLNGILIVDKPAGPTSFDVVHKVRAALGVGKVGHTGTLDPAATGVLPICLGKATRLAGYLTEGDKTYEATVTLGASTDTQDATGTVLERRDVVDLTPARLEATLRQFVGELQQIPPMYSAVKKDGKRLYELARAGKEVEREPRKVTVHALELLEFGVPNFRIRVHCTKGTYVRTLANDIGATLGFGGHLATLRRTKSGNFSIDRAVPLQQILDRRAEVTDWVIPLAEAFSEFTAVTLDLHTLQKKLAHGQPLEVPSALTIAEGQRVRILGPDGDLVAMAERAGPVLKYLRVLLGP